MSLSVHIDNKNKNILILGKGPTQGLYNTTLTGEADDSINLSGSQKRFVYTFIITEAKVFYSLIPEKYISSKQKTLKLNHIHCV